MKDILTQDDLMLPLQNSQSLVIRVEVLDSKTQSKIGIITGIVSGSVSINGESDIRHTCNLSIQPTILENIKLEEGNLVWLDKDIRLSIGMWNWRLNDYIWYSFGNYVYTDTSSTYDQTTNQLTVNCSDYMAKLDGTKNGQLGALVISYPAYEENPETGEPITYNIIRNAIIETLEKLCRITNYRIDDIGEYKAMPEYNDDWEKYREENVNIWNTIPYDQEFSCGCTVLSILTTFRDLYPNYEMYFDMDTNTFICQLKPMCYEDDIFIDDKYIQKVFISENSSTDMTTVKNVCEVWGQSFENDYYSEEVTYANNVYSCFINGYEEKYYNGDIIGLKIPEVNALGAQININNFGTIGIYDESNEIAVSAGKMKADTVYTFKIKKKRIDGNDQIRAYLLGEWQAHAINVLTDGTASNQKVTDSEGVEFVLYSKEYFKHFYNCERVDFQIVPDSPFTVQKLGEILDVKTGGEFENITSDDLAADRAKWENWKNCRLTDNITITTKILPWLYVNKKVSYKSHSSGELHQYIITSISHDLSNNTSSITMYRFYPYYDMTEEEFKNAGTWKALSGYTWNELNNYTSIEITERKDLTMSTLTNFLKLIKPNENEKSSIDIINQNSDLLDSAIQNLTSKVNEDRITNEQIDSLFK